MTVILFWPNVLKGFNDRWDQWEQLQFSAEYIDGLANDCHSSGALVM